MNAAATINPELEALTAGLPDETREALRGLVGGLQSKVGGLQSKVGGLQSKVGELEILIRLREEQLRMARMDKYGPRSEKLSASQLQLLDLEPGVQLAEVEAEASRQESEKKVDAAPEGKQRKKRAAYSRAHPGRSPLPGHLPRKEVIIPCEEAPDGPLVGYEVREELVIKPAEFYVQVLKREKRLAVIADRRTIITAPMPVRIIEKCRFEDSVIIELVVRKYCDHQPAYRQRMIWERDHGIIVNDALLIRCILRAGELFQPLARVAGEELKKGGYIQADETRVAVLQQNGKGRNDTGWFWQYSAPDGLVYFDYQDSRSRAGPKAFLKGYTGTLQSDGYEVYTNLVEEISAHAGCWAHARRKFDAARKAAPKEVPCRDSQAILDEIAALYHVEKEARTTALDADGRLGLRQTRGIVTRLEAFREKIVSVRSRVLPASQLGKACDYTLGQWDKLMVYTRDGRVEIDNNWCENEMRPIALGRKNWMHLGSEESGPKVAAIMTLIASAQRAGANVREYLAWVLPKLNDPATTEADLVEMLPARWLARRAEAVRQPGL
jgi:transposase